jgi:hypothetical protein
LKGSQRLCNEEIKVYVDSVTHRTSIGKLNTDKKKGVVFEPINKPDSKPFGELLNDAKACTAFGLVDGTDLFGEDSHILLNDTGNQKENNRAKVLAF